MNPNFLLFIIILDIQKNITIRNKKMQPIVKNANKSIISYKFNTKLVKQHQLT